VPQWGHFGCANERGDATLDGEIRHGFPDRLEFYQPIGGAASANPPTAPAVMEALLVSLFVVAVGEMGDKTQLLAPVLAARFQRPLLILLGIFVATLANHTLAGVVGAWVRQALPATSLRWLVAASFLAISLWTLMPQRAGERDAKLPSRLGVFTLTTIAFFRRDR